MPFKSEKQRKWMWANDPEMAQKWEDEEKELASEEQIDEALKPEVSEKAKQIFKTMIGDRRDKLMKRYGANAEKVAYGRAIAQAKKQLDKPEEEMKDEKLKEMVKTALKSPIPEKKEVYEWKRDSDEDLDGEDTLFSRASNVLNSYSGKVKGIGDAIEYLSSFNNKGEEYLQDAIREVIRKIGYSDIEERLKIKLEKLIPLFDKQGKYIREDLDIDNIDENQSDKISGMLEILKKYGHDDYKLNKRFGESYTVKQALEVIRQLSGTSLNENSLLKEYTDQNFSGKELIGGLRYPDMFGLQLFKDLFPNSVKNEANAIRSLNAFDKLQYPPNVFVHVGYNEFDADIDGANEKFQIHQSVYYNHNYDDERSPDVVKLSLYKKLGDGKEEEIGQILTKIGEVSKDLKNLDITKRVSEGTCGYGKDGKLGKKPAGPHLLEKKIKEIIKQKLSKSSLEEDYGPFSKQSDASEEEQLAAVKKKARTLKFFKNPSEAVQLAAVKNDGDAIRYIDNPSEAVQLAATQNKSNSIRHIDNPSEKLQLIAVKDKGLNIVHIKNPTKAALLAYKDSGFYKNRDNRPPNYKKMLDDLHSKYGNDKKAENIKEIIKNKIKDMNEDVVKGSNIKKVGDKWRVVSGKTGKLWPQTYDKKEDAEDALQAYHAQNESLVETILAKLRK